MSRFHLSKCVWHATVSTSRVTFFPRRNRSNLSNKKSWLYTIIKHVIMLIQDSWRYQNSHHMATLSYTPICQHHFAASLSSFSNLLLISSATSPERVFWEYWAAAQSIAYTFPLSFALGVSDWRPTDPFSTVIYAARSSRSDEHNCWELSGANMSPSIMRWSGTQRLLLQCTTMESWRLPSSHLQMAPSICNWWLFVMLHISRKLALKMQRVVRKVRSLNDFLLRTWNSSNITSLRRALICADCTRKWAYPRRNQSK